MLGKYLERAYYVPAALQSASHILTHLILTTLCAITKHVLQIKSTKHRQLSKLSQVTQLGSAKAGSQA